MSETSPTDLAVPGVSQLEAISPLDGRYRKHVGELSSICSEFGLIKRRVAVEVEWLVFLLRDLRLRPDFSFRPDDLQTLQDLHSRFDISHAARVQALERVTNHDVKAVEYFVAESLDAIDLGNVKEYVHFGCTSEDINNLAYALMLRDARQAVLLPLMTQLIEQILTFANAHIETPMLSRTHGQTASPTTLGKELVNFAARLTRWVERLNAVEIHAKMNGAVGNFNAHGTAAPDVAWPSAAATFVESLGFTCNTYTTQIEPHDWIADYLNAIVGFNQVLLDIDRDVWAYIALGYFKQKQVAGEVGSSTMPHKVNPIDFENSEGNVGLANAMASHLADKLLVSRWQRDLTDSTALRNVGSVFAYTTIAIRSAIRGLQKLEVDMTRLAADLDDAWEVLAEAVQTVMRRDGVTDAYEKVKEITRGRRLDESLYQEMLGELPLDDDSRARLDRLSPATYVGLAPQLARQGIDEVNAKLQVL